MYDNTMIARRVPEETRESEQIMGISELVANNNVCDRKEFVYRSLDDLFDVGEMENEIRQGNVSVTTSNDMPLSVYKYSKLAPVRRAWNSITLKTRGLVVNDDGVVIGRGFNKFFNLDELSSFGISVDPHSECRVMPKIDGSLGICFKYDDTWLVSTPGSLNSDQAIHATRLMNDKYADVRVEPGMSIMAEIVYPDNKIITDYGNMDDLVLLGATDCNGFWINPDDIEGWRGEHRVHPIGTTIADVLHQRDNDPEDKSEGFVVQVGNMLAKIKYPSYLRLHKARFSLTPKTVWENLCNGSFNELVMMLPDEFYEDAYGMRDDILRVVDESRARVDELGGAIPEGLSRKEKALWINSSTADANVKRWIMTKYVAGNDIEGTLLRAARPVGK